MEREREREREREEGKKCVNKQNEDNREEKRLCFKERMLRWKERSKGWYGREGERERREKE